MDVQAWLEKVKELDQLIDMKQIEHKTLISMATNTSPRPMNGIPFSETGVVSNPVEDCVAKLIMINDEINRLVDEFVDHKKQVINMLEKLSDNECNVLHKRYICYMTWGEIAKDMCCSYMQVWRIKKKAYKNLENILNVISKNDII